MHCEKPNQRDPPGVNERDVSQLSTLTTESNRTMRMADVLLSDELAD